MATSEELYKENPNMGINYGSEEWKQILPFSSNAQAWWVPGKSEWLFGGGATKGMATAPQTAGYQRGYLQNMLGRQAPTMDTGQANQSREQQQQLAQMLFQQAQGQRAGAGELAVNRQANQALAQQTAAAQMARGSNSALAARNAARNQADIGTNAAGQASIAQLQDQQAAYNQLGGLLGQTRAQDIGTAQGNQAAQMQQQQLQIAALAQMLGVDKAQLEQDLEKRKLQTQDKGNLGGLLQAVGGLFASDARLKTDIVDADEEIDIALLNLQPKRYRYKSARHGVGSRVGVMAQHLLDSSAGADIVFEDGEGALHLDAMKALSFALAAVARLDARVRELESK